MRDPGEEDAVLVGAAREGDRQAFALLYHRYKPDVWNLALLTVRDYHEAEDCLQETFVKALRALSAHGSVEAVRPWLLTICRNVCLDRLRARRHRQAVPIDAGELPALRAPGRVDDAWLDLRRAIDSLAPDDREAFLLVDVLGYRSHEAASILGIAAPSTLRSRLARARREVVAAANGADAESPAEIWGVYHRPPDSAIVASFATRPRNGDGGAGLADLLARFDRATGASRAQRGSPDIVEFFDSLDGHIPKRLRVLAVVDGQPAPLAMSARHWLTDHPRWQLREALSHAGWLLEVESLLRAAGTEPRRATLAALDAPTPFLWTHTR